MKPVIHAPAARAPVGPDSLLATNVPHVELKAVVHQALDVETLRQRQHIIISSMLTRESNAMLTVSEHTVFTNKSFQATACLVQHLAAPMQARHYWSGTEGQHWEQQHRFRSFQLLATVRTMLQSSDANECNYGCGRLPI